MSNPSVHTHQNPQFQSNSSSEYFVHNSYFLRIGGGGGIYPQAGKEGGEGASAPLPSQAGAEKDLLGLGEGNHQFRPFLPL